MEQPQRRRDLLDLAIILAVWTGAVLIARPYGNFPLDDDGDYALATWRFAETGRFHFTNFTAVSLRAQVIWGALWTRLFGESFDVLHASTMTLSALTIIVVFFTLRHALNVTGTNAHGESPGRPSPSPHARSLRNVATLAFAFHPIFFWASFTYMTEVPFVLLSALALFLFFRALSEDRFDVLIAACAVAIVSWFVRQTGITNLFAPLALVCILRGRLTPRWKRFAMAIASCFVLFVALLVFKRAWLTGSPDEFANHFKMWTEVTFRTAEQISMVAHYLSFNAQNAALFFLPLTAALIFTIRRRARWEYALLALSAVIVALCVGQQIAIGQPLPYRVSAYNCCATLVDWGLGLQTLSDIWRWNLTYPVHLTWTARLILTWGSAALAALLIMHVVTAVFRDDRLFVKLAAATTIAGTLALFGSGLYIDRYSFDSAWSIGLFVPFLVTWNLRRTRLLVVVSLVAIAVFDTLGTQEYFAWNRARWQALEALRARGVPEEQIDGGTEPIAYFEISKMTQREKRRFIIGFKPRRYVLTFQPVDGYVVVDRHPYNGWLARHDGFIYTLQKK